MVDTRYRKNAGAVYTLKYHLVRCPKYRRPVLQNEVADRLKHLLYEKASELNACLWRTEQKRFVRPLALLFEMWFV